MRHQVVKHSFGRKQGPRLALIKGLVNSLVTHGRIKTTLPKAKELRRHIERAVTISKAGTLHARRLLMARLSNQTSVSSLMSDIGKRFVDRPGGYTRIVKLGPRPGDCADMAYIEFVDYKAPEVTEGGPTVDPKVAKALAARRLAKRRSVRKMKSKSRQRNRQ